MPSVNAYERSSYRTDLKALLARGLSMTEAARHLGISRATAYRILNDTKEARR